MGGGSGLLEGGEGAAISPLLHVFFVRVAWRRCECSWICQSFGVRSRLAEGCGQAQVVQCALNRFKGGLGRGRVAEASVPLAFPVSDGLEVVGFSFSREVVRCHRAVLASYNVFNFWEELFGRGVDVLGYVD